MNIGSLSAPFVLLFVAILGTACTAVNKRETIWMSKHVWLGEGSREHELPLRPRIDDSSSTGWFMPQTKQQALAELVQLLGVDLAKRIAREISARQCEVGAGRGTSSCIRASIGAAVANDVGEPDMFAGDLMREIKALWFDAKCDEAQEQSLCKDGQRVLWPHEALMTVFLALRTE